MNKFWNKNSGPLDPDEVLADSLGSFEVSDYLERKIEKPIGKYSLFIFLILIAASIAYLMIRAASLQIQKGEDFFLKSQENRFFKRVALPPRGIIYDRFRKEMVRNESSFGIIFEKSEFLRSEHKNLEVLAEKLAGILNRDKQELFEIGLPQDSITNELPAKIIIQQNIDQETVFKIIASADELPGIKIFEGYKRIYKDSFAYSHLLGFVGKVSKENISKNPLLLADDTVGKNGIEYTYDHILRGEKGIKIVEVDSKGNESRFKLTKEPKEGSAMILTVDSNLQSKAYELFQNYTESKKAGSIIILDVKTGAVRAIISFPGYDINKFGSYLTQNDFNDVLNDTLKPLFNRVISGEFPAGSTVKPFIAAAALEENIIEPSKTIYDEGFIEIENPYRPGESSIFKDWKVHGWIDFYDAIAHSANVYFYMLGGGYKNQKGLGIDRLKKYAQAFGLGSKLGIDLPGEKAGLFPDPETKKISEPNDPVWRIGDTYNASIGQGGVRVTPLQIAALTASVANGGTLYKPYILDSILSLKNSEKNKSKPEIIRKNIVSEESLSHVQKGMRLTVKEGTARQLLDLPVEVAAKTGTAQTGSGAHHAWVASYAPYEDPEIAMVVMIEHAGEGSTVAMPITKEILNWYFTNKQIKP